MRSFFSIKAVRLLLSLSVSIWMAGGCLFGCSGTTMGATRMTRKHDRSRRQLATTRSHDAAQAKAKAANHAHADTAKGCHLSLPLRAG